MRFRNFFLIYFIVFIFFSCSKKEEISFHGKVTTCDGIPLGSVQISIMRNYAKGSGSETRENIGLTHTQSNGEYLLNMDVSLPGCCGWYTVSATSTNKYFMQTYQSDHSDHENNIQTDFILFDGTIAKCHIKNVSPVNNNDVFDSLTYYKDGLYRYMPVAYNLSGMSVDTSVIFYVLSDDVKVQYTYTKDGITTVGNDTVTSACNDTAFIDIFY